MTDLVRQTNDAIAKVSRAIVKSTSVSEHTTTVSEQALAATEKALAAGENADQATAQIISTIEQTSNAVARALEGCESCYRHFARTPLSDS